MLKLESGLSVAALINSATEWNSGGREIAEEIIAQRLSKFSTDHLPPVFADPVREAIKQNVYDNFAMHKSASDYSLVDGAETAIRATKYWTDILPFGIELDSDLDELRDIAERESRNVERAHTLFMKAVNRGRLQGAAYRYMDTVRKVERAQHGEPINPAMPAGNQKHLVVDDFPMDAKPSEIQEFKELIEAYKIDLFFKRWSNPKIWRRNLKRLIRRSEVQIARILQFVGRGRNSYFKSEHRSQYLPDETVKDMWQEQDAFDEWAQTTYLGSCAGDLLTLASIIGNKEEKQAAETALRARAQFEQTKKRNLKGYLLTVTCPSRFHSTVTIKNKKSSWSTPNKNFDPSLTAQDAVSWMQRNWVKSRARIQKLLKENGYEPKLDFQFFGGLEGHADATPHRHFAIYIPESTAKEVEKIIRENFIHESHYGDGISEENLEAGALIRRVDFEPFNEEHGAVGYVMKMIMYPLKTLIVQNKKSEKGKERPTAEALYALAINARRFSMNDQKIGIYRFIRRCSDPDYLPNELRKVWHQLHGIAAYLQPDDFQLARTDDKRISGTELEDLRLKTRFGVPSKTQRTDYFNGSVDEHDMLFFLESIATDYRPCYSESELYDIEFKTLNDYANEDGEVTFPQFKTVRRGPGAFSVSQRVDDGDTSYDRYISDYYSFGTQVGVDAKGKPIYCRNFAKRYERILNQNGQPKIPSRYNFIYRFDANHTFRDENGGLNQGQFFIGQCPFVKTWDFDREAGLPARAELQREKEVQFSPYSPEQIEQNEAKLEEAKAWLAESQKQEKQRALDAEKRLQKIREDLGIRFKELRKTRKLHLYIPSQGGSSSPIDRRQTVELLDLDELYEKYGKVQLDDNNTPIPDGNGGYLLEFEGSRKEPEYRRPFGPQVALVFDPGRGLVPA